MDRRRQSTQGMNGEGLIGELADAWIVEVMFPWDMLGGPPQYGDVWLMNFARDRRVVSEQSYWSCGFGTFQDSTRYGRVTFAGP